MSTITTSSAPLLGAAGALSHQISEAHVYTELWPKS